MNQPKKTFSILSFLLIVLIGASALLAQTDQKPQAEVSYEAILQVVIGQQDASMKIDIPPALSPISRQLRENFTFPSYRLANTFIGRISSAGTLEYKSISDILSQPADQDAPIFVEWNLGRLQSVGDNRGQNVLYVQPFRFGARVPVRTETPRGSDGKPYAVVNYEAIGLTINRVGLPESKPTLIGTLSLPKTTGTMFLVLTIRPTSN